MSLELFVLLSIVVPIGLATWVGWSQGEELSPWLLALPTPVLVLLFFLPHGFHLMKHGDGTDMGQLSGYLEVIFGSIMGVLSFAAGLAAAYLKRRRARSR